MPNRVYPPVVNNTLPATIIKKDNSWILKIPYEYSQYNNIKDMRLDIIQLSIRDRDTHLSVLSKEEKGIYRSLDFVNLYSVNLKKAIDGSYYIRLTNNNSYFNLKLETGKQYLIQLRCFSTDTQINNHNMLKNPTPTYADINDFTNNYSQFISEWSTVSIMWTVSEPNIKINNTQLSYGYDEWGNDVFSSSNQFILDTLWDLKFEITYDEDNKDKQDILTKYYYTITNSHGEIINDQYQDWHQITNEYNKFIETIDYDFPISATEYYTCEVFYQTQKAYQGHATFSFRINSQSYSNIIEKIKFGYEFQEDYARMKIYINLLNNLHEELSQENIKIIFKRTSNQSQFKQWETVRDCVFNIIDKETSFEWFDYTIESGVWYKYCLIIEGYPIEEDVITRIVHKVANNTKAELSLFHEMYLNGSGRQLCIKFNPNISSFSHNISENKIDTLGSQYPFFYRAGKMDYKTFPISGTISFLMDEDEINTSLIQESSNALGQPTDQNCNALYHKKENLFITDEELLNCLLENNLYNDYQLNYTSYRKDIILEKMFRDKVIGWLLEDSPKLYRTTSEGNIIIKLMDISFTPNNQLGRLVYDFSCTAYEVAAATAENCDKYLIQLLGSTAQLITTTNINTTSYKVLGQITARALDSDTDLLQRIKEQINFSNNENDSFNFYIERFNLLRCSIVTDNNINAQLSINNEKVRIGNTNTYIRENLIEGFEIFELSSTYTEILIDYVVQVKCAYVNTLPQTSSFVDFNILSSPDNLQNNSNRHLDQINLLTQNGTNIINIIKNSYNYDSSKIHVIGMTIYAPKDTKFTVNNTTPVFVMNNTGKLVFDIEYANEAPVDITSLVFQTIAVVMIDYIFEIREG